MDRPSRSRSLFPLALALALLSACDAWGPTGSSGPLQPGADAAPLADGGAGDAGGGGARASCDAYLACLAKASPATFPAALAAYGPDGTCWRTDASATAAACASACESSREQLASSFPAVAECERPSAGDAGDGGRCAASERCAAASTISVDACGRCDSCGASACCAPATACANSSDCVALLRCFRGCGGRDAGAGCAQQCVNTYSSAVSTWMPVQQCLTASCKAECGLGSP